MKNSDKLPEQPPIPILFDLPPAVPNPAAMQIQHLEPKEPISEIENQLSKFSSEYQKMLEKLADFKGEFVESSIKKSAKDIVELLTDIQKKMHEMVETLISIEEPEFLQNGITQELSNDLPKIKEELYMKYNEILINSLQEYIH